MAFKLLNRARMSVSGTPGTGTLTLNAAGTGFQSFSAAGMSDGDTTSYLIEDGSPVGSVWEIGVGTYHSSGTLSRDTVTQSSAGGTTKISATSNAVVSGIVQASDLMASLGSAGSTAPTVVQHAYSVGTNAFGAEVITLGSAPTPGNILVAIGNCSVNSGANGFNWTSADFQYNQNSTTAYKVGYGTKVVQSGDTAAQTIGTVGIAATEPFNGVLLEISGANLALASSSEGSIGSGSTTVQASNYANSLGIFFVGGDGAANPSITAPGSFQVSQYNSGITSLKAGWGTLTSAGNAGVTASVASGTTRALALNIPGA
jgi:hypothetical protein